MDTQYSTFDNKIQVAQDKIDAIKVDMHDNINKVINRGDNIDNLVDKTDELDQHAFTFRKQAQTVHNRLWWQKCKMNACGILFAFCVLAFLWLIVWLSTRD